MSSTGIRRFSTALSIAQWAMSKPRPSVMGSPGWLQQNSSAATTRDAPRRSASKEKYPSNAPTSSTVLPAKVSGNPTSCSLDHESSTPGVVTPPPRSMVWNHERPATSWRSSASSRRAGSCSGVEASVSLVTTLLLVGRGTHGRALSVPGQHRPVEPARTVDHPLPAVELLVPSPPGHPEAPAELGVGQQPLQRGAQRDRVVGGDQQPRLAVEDDLSHPAHVGGDHRLLEHHGFEQHEAERLVARGHHQHVAASVEG